MTSARLNGDRRIEVIMSLLAAIAVVVTVFYRTGHLNADSLLQGEEVRHEGGGRSGSPMDQILTPGGWKGLQYGIGIWYEPARLDRDSSLRLSERSLCEALVAENDTIPHSCQICDSLVSPYFRSTYYIMLWQDGRGNLPPHFAVVASDSTGIATPFATIDPDAFFLYSVKEQPEKLIDYMVSDRKWNKPDSRSATDVAVDIVSVVCPWRPVLFVNNISEVRQFSDLVHSEWTWGYVEENDSLDLLLHSFRLRGVALNKYLSDYLAVPYYDDGDFAAYRYVKPPTLTENPLTGTERVMLFTWSPDGGTLVRWKVYLSKNGSFDAVPEILTKRLGFYFRFM